MCVAEMYLNHFADEPLTRFNKIAIQDKGPDGKWTKKPLAYRESKIFHLCVTRPPEMCQPFLNIFMLLAVTQSVDNLFHSFGARIKNITKQELCISWDPNFYCSIQWASQCN